MQRFLPSQDANTMSLFSLGFSAFFQRQQHQSLSRGVPARVTRVSGEWCSLRGEGGELRARIPRRLRRDAQLAPVVGDWVLVTLEGADHLLCHVFERRTQIVRGVAGRQTRLQVIAANVDVVFVVTGLDGDFNPRRIERYLALVAAGGARAVVLLTKAALCSDVAAKLEAASCVAPGVPVRCGLETIAVVTPPRTASCFGCRRAERSSTTPVCESYSCGAMVTGSTWPLAMSATLRVTATSSIAAIRTSRAVQSRTPSSAANWMSSDSPATFSCVRKSTAPIDDAASTTSELMAAASAK
jgi:hypothetical protein